MRKSTWTTYHIEGYSHDVASDQRSAGGIHSHQVRRTQAGWQKRVKQTNGRYEAYSAVYPISDQDGEAAFASAAQKEVARA